MKKLLQLCLMLAFLPSIVFSQTVILDFETTETSTVFQYFGSTLENEVSSVIANPDASGINTSAMVSDFTKPADSETWAGGFATTTLKEIDLSGGGMICMKVWFSNPGNVGFKLESGTQADWITTAEVETTGEWTEICFDASNPSIEDPMTPAAGGVYGQVVLFFDFGEVLSEERMYFFDDIVVNAASTEPADITFAVDMNGYGGSFNEVYVSGTFNNWADDAELLSDADGDGVYTGTVPDVEIGAHEYLFQTDGFTDQEEFDRSDLCTVTDEFGNFTNRRIVVTGDATLEPVCWESCYACNDRVNITFNVAQGVLSDVSPEGLFVAGGTGFGVPGDNLLSDDDGDGIYSITIERQRGFESFYTFTNGICPNFSCKESIAGQPCSDPQNFDDRLLGPVDNDVTVSTCFGICSDNTDCETDEFKTVTLSVDMNDYTGGFTTVFAAGTFNNWSEDAFPLTDSDGDGVWSGDIDLFPGSFQYKFHVDGWTDEEIFMDGEPCTETDGSGQFVNRTLEVVDDMSVCHVWNTCDVCMSVGIEDLEIVTDLFSITPNIIQSDLNISFNSQEYGDAELIIQNGLGQLVYHDILINKSSALQLDFSDHDAGIFYATLIQNNKRQTLKFIKQ